jgi:hypothetical protein
MDDLGGCVRRVDGSHCSFSELEVAIKLRYCTLLQKQFTQALSLFLSFFLSLWVWILGELLCLCLLAKSTTRNGARAQSGMDLGVANGNVTTHPLAKVRGAGGAAEQKSGLFKTER